MDAGAAAAVTTLLAATAAGAGWVGVNGRFRTRRAPVDRTGDDGAGPAQDLVALGAAPGERGTLVQFSSAFCSPCRATRRVLADVASGVAGVEHVEVDAESHLELVRRWQVLRTPTTVVLDGAGREVSRASGVPRKEQVLAALARAQR